jgi:hypothetical protein
MANKRKNLSKKIRFEVFKRDSFKCQYCGTAAPEVILHVDHIEPHSLNGSNDIMNLITACDKCNLGKSDRKLDDQSVVTKSKAQADQINERRIQLEMMMQWKQELHDIDGKELDLIGKHWESKVKSYSLTENGRSTLKKIIKKYGAEATLNAIDTASLQYLEYNDDGKPTQDSVDIAFKKIGGILRVEKLSKNNPELKELYYIRGILRKRVYVNETYVMTLLKEGLEAGLEVEEMKELAKTVRNWTEFKECIEGRIAQDSPSEMQEPLDQKTISFGNAVDLTTLLQETCLINDEDANEITDSLGELCASFSKYVEDHCTDNDDDSRYRAYTLLSQYIQSNEFLSDRYENASGCSLKKLNSLLSSNLESDIPFVYYAGSTIEVMRFGLKEHYIQFINGLIGSKISFNGENGCDAIQKMRMASFRAMSLIHIGIRNLMLTEFERVGLSVSIEMVSSILKYYSYESIISVFETWGMDYDDEGNPTTKEGFKYSWENYLLELSVNGIPEYLSLIKEGDAGDFMKIYQDCNSFAEALLFKNGVLTTAGVHSWDEYIAEIKSLEQPHIDTNK